MLKSQIYAAIETMEEKCANLCTEIELIVVPYARKCNVTPFFSK